jgi:RHS repeat-associated protein
LIHNDHLATPQKMTDSSGVVRWSADYKPFGEATVDQNVTTITNNLRFPGQYFDVETGLNYNYRRDYNPVLGSYIEADPIGNQEGQNHLYIYGEANPINLTDPMGLSGDTYQSDPCKHGGPHIDRYDSGGKNIGRYRADGTGIPHKGKVPPSIPKSDLAKFTKAAKLLGKCCSAIVGVVLFLADAAEAEAPTLDTPPMATCTPCHNQ